MLHAKLKLILLGTGNNDDIEISVLKCAHKLIVIDAESFNEADGLLLVTECG